MKLYHVSEESNIEVFKPRKPYRDDMKKSPSLVWAINEECLPNFLTPRDCPRVTYHVGKKTTEEDRNKYFSSKETKHVVAIEHQWFKRMLDTSLYVYEFDISNFVLQDEVAGYYVSDQLEIPKNIHTMEDLFAELFRRKVEVRLISNLLDFSEEIKKTSLNWSMCRMKNAQKMV